MDWRGSRIRRIMSEKSETPGARRNQLESFLRKHTKIGIDTAVFIYQLEENPNYIELTQRIFDWLEGPRARGVTSTITMTELLVHPYRDDNQEAVDTYYAFLSTYPHLEWVPPTLAIADRAAGLRAKYNLRTPDAIQAATAVTEKASGFISNDSGFRKIQEIEVFLLDELTKIPV